MHRDNPSMDGSGKGDFEAPPDRYNIAYIIFFMAGVGTLLPWNFFCTAIPYFQFKLRNVSDPNSTTLNPDNFSPEQLLFGNYLALCSMLPLALFNLLNLLLMKWISSFVRFASGSVVVFTMFVLTVSLVRVDLDAPLFLGITLFSVVLINSASAIVQGSLLGIASVLPSRNIRAILEGQAIAGVLAALAQIASLAGSSDFTTSALGYFLVALFFLGMSTVLTLMLKWNAHFLHYWNLEYSYTLDEEKNQKTSKNVARPRTDTVEMVTESNEVSVIQSSSVPLLKSLGEMWVHGICTMLTLMYTLMLFPALLQLIKSMHYDLDSAWSSTFFVPVVVFLSFNVCDWIGRMLAGFIKWPRINQRWILLALCVSRVILVPLCTLLNQQPRHHLPVVFNHDAYTIILVILLGLTNGYLISLSMTYGPSFASPGNNEGAGIALSIYLSLGLSLGVAFSAGLVLAI